MENKNTISPNTPEAYETHLNKEEAKLYECEKCHEKFKAAELNDDCLCEECTEWDICPYCDNEVPYIIKDGACDGCHARGDMEYERWREGG